MGSIVSQVGQKCYRECEKSSRGVHVHGILTFPEPSGSPVLGTTPQAPLRPASLEASCTPQRKAELRP
jgi:hypothetical protein